MSAKIFSTSDVPRLKKEYKVFGSYLKLAAKYRCSAEAVRLAIKPETRKKYDAVRRRHPIKLARRTRLGTKRWRESHPERFLLVHAKHRAKKYDLPFNLEEKDLTIPSTCPALGVSLLRVGEKRTDNSPSVDRIKPKLGYVKGNVQVISWLANRIKGTQTDPKIFEALAAYLRRNERKK